MKSQKPLASSRPFLQNEGNKKKPELFYSNVIKVPLTASTSVISDELTKKLFALKDNAGLSPVANKAPLRLLLNASSNDINQNVPLILSSLYKKDIYRIDLSQLAGQNIVDTEKNLDEIFKSAQQNDWILFFDEADALFGKRTDVSDAHDKYANQDVGYLLQRIESYTGILLIKCLSPGCLQLSSQYHFKTLG